MAAAGVGMIATIHTAQEAMAGALEAKVKEKAKEEMGAGAKGTAPTHTLKRADGMNRAKAGAKETHNPQHTFMKHIHGMTVQTCGKIIPSTCCVHMLMTTAN